MFFVIHTGLVEVILTKIGKMVCVYMKIAGIKWGGAINVFINCMGWGGGVVEILLTQMQMYPTPLLIINDSSLSPII